MPPSFDSSHLEDRLAQLRQEHVKCKQQVAHFEAQALRIEGAITLIGEMLAPAAAPSA